MDKLKMFKIVGYSLSIAGMIVTAVVGDKENKLHLEKLVNDRIAK